MTEFELIKKYFQRAQPCRDDVLVGIGDDAALVSMPAGFELAIATDILVADVHFETHWQAEDIGYRALAVNLSDLAAMGAQPSWMTLGLTLPEINESWLSGFSRGLLQLADQYHLQLIGGDMSQGPLAIAIQVHGFVEQGKRLLRSGAAVGDDIYVTGQLGAASFALKQAQASQLSLAPSEQQAIEQALYHPPVLVTFSCQLATLAHAAIDISDGLAADLGHLLQQSNVGAELQWSAIPVMPVLTKHLAASEQQTHVLHGGDEYQLCFTASPLQRAEIMALARDFGIACSKIGQITAETGLVLHNSGEQSTVIPTMGYQHFG